MSQPSWKTLPGNLGFHPSNIPLNIKLEATPTGIANSLTYSLLNGSLPEGDISLSSDGRISGTLTNAGISKLHTFTVRVTDEYGNIKDGTFSITISAYVGVQLSAPNTKLFDIQDSEYVFYQIPLINPVTTNKVFFRISAGKLPPGLFLSVDGSISGWAKPPVLLDGSPTEREFSFSITASSDLGSDSKPYSIKITNKQLTSIAVKRSPAILNSKPLQLPLDKSDPFLGYYTLVSNTLPIIDSGKYFSFKVMGYDFDRDQIEYNFSSLPKGLLGDTTTGWISGVPEVTEGTIERFEISVVVFKTADPSFRSDAETFFIDIRNNDEKEIVWKSPKNLGTYNNGTICDIKLEAVSPTPLSYAVTGGKLPPNISLTQSGELVGRFPFQPEKTIRDKNYVSTFTFEVTANSSGYALISNVQTFTLNILQRFESPVETLYFKAAPNILGRQIIKSLLNSESLIPAEYLYRPNDPYFGKAADVRIVHQYGVVATSTLSYLNAIPNNHYRQKFIFDRLRTAIARDENNNVLYEVVYAPLIDPATNAEGQSVPMSIAWPQDIGLRYGDWYDSRTDKFTSSTGAHTSFSPGYVKLLNPVSLENMRKEIEQNLEYDYDQSLLPKWMTSQQHDGNTLGYVEAWVLCYTLPGKSETVRSNIENYWAFELSDIDFEIDRFIVDRSATFNWNTTLTRPVWGNLPSASPAPESLEQYDDVVLFNRETILPKI